jgi:hypothetical protein
VSDERLVQTPVRTSFSALAVALCHDRALWIESVSSGPRVDREVAHSQDKVVWFIDWALGWFQTVLNPTFLCGAGGVGVAAVESRRALALLQLHLLGLVAIAGRRVLRIVPVPRWVGGSSSSSPLHCGESRRSSPGT